VEPFAPRPIRYLGLRESHGWCLKTYTVLYGGGAFDAAGFEPAVQLALSSLPPADPDCGRPGLGFIIAHQGRTGDYTVLAWWDHENELPVRLWVRRDRDEPWREAATSESFCVWDLEILWAEREAWVRTMMSDTGPDPGAWLKDVHQG